MCIRDRFKNVTALNQRAAGLAKQPDTMTALKIESDAAAREEKSTAAMLALLEELDIDGGIDKLKALVTPLIEPSRAAEDSPSRRVARRLLTTLRASTAGIRNREVQKVLDQISAAVGSW